ncbi:AMP-binding protein [Streptomyces sp. NPDC002643]
MCGPEEALAHWRRSLTPLPQAVPLPTDRPHPPRPRPDRETRALSGVPDASRPERLAAFVALLHRYSGATDLTIGYDGLPLRVSVEHQPSFRELVRRVAQARDDTETHRLPIGLLVEELRPAPLPGGGLFFNTAFGDEPSIPVDVLLEADENTAWVTYDPGLLDGTTAERLLGHYRTLLSDGLARPDASVVRLDLMGPQEYRQVVVDSNATTLPAPADTWPTLFAERVRSSPDAVLTVAGDEKLTYAELDDRANRLAHALLARGAGPERIIALALPRSAELAVAVAAILKAGAVCLPIGHEDPAERIAPVLDDARPVCGMTTAETAHVLAANANGMALLALDSPAMTAELADGPAHDPTDADRGAPLTGQSAAHIDYHGQDSAAGPVGVVLPHRAPPTSTGPVAVSSDLLSIEPTVDITPTGIPAPGTRAYVLDAFLRPVPAGVTGELYLGGECLPRGCLGRAALTAARFVADPFGAPGGRLHRTGDLVRRRPDGHLEFIGRITDATHG